jgi:hypothetical protein
MSKEAKEEHDSCKEKSSSCSCLFRRWRLIALVLVPFILLPLPILWPEPAAR